MAVNLSKTTREDTSVSKRRVVELLVQDGLPSECEDSDAGRLPLSSSAPIVKQALSLCCETDAPVSGWRAARSPAKQESMADIRINEKQVLKNGVDGMGVVLPSSGRFVKGQYRAFSDKYLYSLQ